MPVKQCRPLTGSWHQGCCHYLVAEASLGAIIDNPTGNTEAADAAAEAGIASNQ